MSVVFGVGADVLKRQGAGGRHNEDFEHEVIEGFEVDLAEWLGFERLAVVVPEELRPRGVVLARQPLRHVHFKLVTDAFNTCAHERKSQGERLRRGTCIRTYRRDVQHLQYLRRTFCSCTLSPIQSVQFSLHNEQRIENRDQSTYIFGTRLVPSRRRPATLNLRLAFVP